MCQAIENQEKKAFILLVTNLSIILKTLYDSKGCILSGFANV